MTLSQSYNKYTAKLYHLVFNIKKREDIEHLKHCKLCKRRFEKWIIENEKK